MRPPPVPQMPVSPGLSKNSCGAIAVPPVPQMPTKSGSAG